MPVTLSAVSAGLGAVQSVAGLIGAKKAQRQLEQMQSPYYQPSQAINDYYSKALLRYNVNPYDSPLYQMQQRNINRGVTSGISALTDRKAGLEGIGALIQQGQDQSLQAGAAAQEQQAQQLSQLGQAAAAKKEDDQYAFNINKLMPFERKTNLLAAKAAGQTQVMNAGLQNVFGGIGGMAQAKTAKSIYGFGGQRKTPFSGPQFMFGTPGVFDTNNDNQGYY